mmetsp:Transcript_9275/g.14868  ORF Transcript_9275/g.14868 Transcript_9275/m.14868 type:complete len:91 (+) Transcript_9275:12-284(+)
MFSQLHSLLPEGAFYDSRCTAFSETKRKHCSTDVGLTDASADAKEQFALDNVHDTGQRGHQLELRSSSTQPLRSRIGPSSNELTVIGFFP